MTQYRYEIVISWSDEDSAFIATVPELPGCVADGATYRDAVAAAEEAIAAWIETATGLGRKIPEPRSKRQPV